MKTASINFEKTTAGYYSKESFKLNLFQSSKTLEKLNSQQRPMKTTETNNKKPQRNRIYRSETGYSTADMQKTTAECLLTIAKCHLPQRNVKNGSEMSLNLVKSLSAAVWSVPPSFGAFRSDLQNVDTVSFIKACVEPPLNKEFPNTCR